MLIIPFKIDTLNINKLDIKIDTFLSNNNFLIYTFFFSFLDSEMDKSKKEYM